MNGPVVVLALVVLAVIGALPRIFFRRGRLNLAWWLTAVPFFAAAATVAAALAGRVAPAVPATPLSEAFATILLGASLLMIGLTLGSHRTAVSLWHQDDDAPDGLVTHGAYARIRHPFYSAFLLGLIGCVAALPHPLTLAALLYAVVRLDRTAAREERRLLDSTFGAGYASYLARTGRFLPRLTVQRN
jgi:protein-S-isoprenylcysteine O-methyltransferase Ste14